MQIEPVEQIDLQEGVRSPTMITTMEDTVGDNPSTKRGCYANTKVFSALKPLMFMCCAAGLLFGVDFRRDGMKKYFTFSHFYSFVIMIILAANLLGYLMVFDTSANFDLLVMNLTMSIYHIECFAHFVCFYVASCTYKRLPEFFIQWEKAQLVYSFPLISIKRQAYICAAILWIIIIIVIAGNSYIIFETHLQSVILGPVVMDHPQIKILKIAKIVVGIYLAIAWVASSMFMFLVAKILSQEFTGITRQIRDSDGDKIKEILEPVRRHHQRLCKLVGHADEIFSMQIAVNFAGSFPMMCLVMYVIIYDDQSGLDRMFMILMEIILLVITFARILMDCISGAMLNVAVSMRITTTSVN